ncbi:MAG: peptidase M20, partial [Prevotella bivia]|nr:peptidase M20 [Prevotella bivia]
MIKEYIKENEGRILEELFSLIRIPSVSAQPEKHGKDMLRCAERWKE